MNENDAKYYKLNVVEKSYACYYVLSDKSPEEFNTIEEFYAQAEFESAKHFDSEVMEIDANYEEIMI